MKETHITVSKPAKLRKEALDALQSMSEAFYQTFHVPILVVSGYRSYEYQVGIKSHGCPDSLCAKAGHSEHQTGLAVDLFDVSTADEFLANKTYKQYFVWLQLHAAEYGFHNSYQKGIAVDGYDTEPWHWRYLGHDLAEELLRSNKDFTEWYTINSSK